MNNYSNPAWFSWNKIGTITLDRRLPDGRDMSAQEWLTGRKFWHQTIYEPIKQIIDILSTFTGHVP